VLPQVRRESFVRLDGSRAFALRGVASSEWILFRVGLADGEAPDPFPIRL
jgi:hypothetical protein